MKVGLITIHDIYNYGSIYQALATQKVLERLGCECELIDYKYPNARHHAEVSTSRKALSAFLRGINSSLKNCLPGKPYALYQARYEQFKRENYKLSSTRYPTVESLMENPPQYDIYLSGSDQLWRPKFVNDDPSFFLGFAPEDARRVSYASSFGVHELDSKYTAIYRSYLEKFSSIAVREVYGQAIVEKLLEREVPVVLDPTLLLNQDDWRALSAPFEIDKPYILCYGFHPNNKRMEDMAIEMGRKYGLKVVRSNGKFYDYFNRKIHYVIDAGPAEALSLFANASFVMAQSFHATAFSINFKKPFYALLRGDADHDSRQIHLLTTLGLMDRVRYLDRLMDAGNYPVDVIDYTFAEAQLQKEREGSIAYLREALSDSLLGFNS